MKKDGLTETQLVYVIRQTPALDKLFDRLNYEGRREVMRQAAGDTWRLEELIAGVLEDSRYKAAKEAARV